MDQKKRRIINLENIEGAIKEAFDEAYPKGFQDYFPAAVKYDKPDGTHFYAVTVETEDTIALVKVDVETDNSEDLERWLDAESGEPQAEEDEEDSLPDDNIAQYSNGEDDPGDQE